MGALGPQREPRSRGSFSASVRVVGSGRRCSPSAPPVGVALWLQDPHGRGDTGMCDGGGGVTRSVQPGRLMEDHPRELAGAGGPRVPSSPRVRVSLQRGLPGWHFLLRDRRPAPRPRRRRPLPVFILPSLTSDKLCFCASFWTFLRSACQSVLQPVSWLQRPSGPRM